MDEHMQFLSPKPHEWIKGRVVGSGSFGTVNLALSKVTGAFFVVKSAQSGKGIHFLENEADILESLDSPYVVKYLGRDNLSNLKHGRREFSIFLEYIGGGSLADVQEKFGGKFEEHVIRLYTRDILYGLHYLHRNGIVHCDLKCKNVLVDTFGKVKLGDFGLAKKVRNKKTNLPLENSWQYIGGSPLWMAPEVVRKEGLDFASDIWSLGCTIIEMAIGKPPWGDNVSNPMAATFMCGYSNASPKLPMHFSMEGLDFLTKCFERNPRKRLTAEELLNHPFVVKNMKKGKVGSCSPASVLDVGIIDMDCDLHEKECRAVNEFWDRNPFSSKSTSCERKGIEIIPNWQQEDSDYETLDGWITVRSS